MPDTIGPTSPELTASITSSSRASPAASSPIANSAWPCPSIENAIRSASRKRACDLVGLHGELLRAEPRRRSRARRAEQGSADSRVPDSRDPDRVADSPRLNQPPACAIWPRIIRQNAAQNAHRAASARSPGVDMTPVCVLPRGDRLIVLADQVGSDCEPVEVGESEVFPGNSSQEAVRNAPAPVGERFSGASHEAQRRTICGRRAETGRRPLDAGSYGSSRIRLLRWAPVTMTG